MTAQWHYDPTVDAVTIRVRPGQVARTEQLADGVLVDYDADGHILRIELLDVQQNLSLVTVGPVTVTGRLAGTGPLTVTSGGAPRRARL
jgi:uncharacterized protein YuzE